MRYQAPKVLEVGKAEELILANKVGNQEGPIGLGAKPQLGSDYLDD